MKNYIEWLSEAQRYFTKTGYDELKKYKDDPNVYISYRNINKLGINPINRYNTPTAIYAYPLKEIWHKIEYNKDSSNVPFAGEHPNIYVFKLKDEYKKTFIEDAYQYSSADYDRDIERLKRYFNDVFSKEYITLKTYDADEYPIEYLNYKIKSAMTSANIKNPFGYMWYILLNMSNYIWDVRQTNDSSAIWNFLMRKVLGYCGVADKRGQGVIHHAEPVQALFLFKDCIEEIQLVRNINHDRNHIIKKSVAMGDYRNVFNKEFIYLDERLILLVYNKLGHKRFWNEIFEKYDTEEIMKFLRINYNIQSIYPKLEELLKLYTTYNKKNDLDIIFLVLRNDILQKIYYNDFDDVLPKYIVDGRYNFFADRIHSNGNDILMALFNIENEYMREYLIKYFVDRFFDLDEDITYKRFIRNCLQDTNVISQMFKKEYEKQKKERGI